MNMVARGSWSALFIALAMTSAVVAQSQSVAGVQAGAAFGNGYGYGVGVGTIGHGRENVRTVTIGSKR